MSGNNFTSNFFVVPSRIINLPGLTLAFLKFYETIFQFWNSGNQCYLSNDSIKERTGISSSSTIQEAFEFFEKHKELKRVQKGKRRFIVQPEKMVEIDTDNPVDKSKNNSIKSKQPLATARAASRPTETLPLATARHNNNNINNKNLNKSSCEKSNAKKHDFADSMNQMANEKKHIEAHEAIKKAPMPDELRKSIGKWKKPSSIREIPKKEYQDPIIFKEYSIIPSY